MEYKKAIGALKLVALVKEDFDYLNCGYKIYRDSAIAPVLVKTALNYKELLKGLKSLGLDPYDIEETFTVLMENKHDTAHFGVFGSLLFTEDSLEANKEQGMA